MKLRGEGGDGKTKCLPALSTMEAEGEGTKGFLPWWSSSHWPPAWRWAQDFETRTNGAGMATLVVKTILCQSELSALPDFGFEIAELLCPYL